MAIVTKHALIFIKRNMSFARATSIVKQNYIIDSCFVRNFNNVPIEYTQNQDPAPLFFNAEIQGFLKQLTQVNLEKVYRHRRLQTKQLETPTYKFMTDNDLKRALEDAAERANNMLQMPPVVKVREPIEFVLSEDPALQGYDPSKLVFTDITYGISDRDRLIVVRDTDGKLIKADWNTRQRMNQIYFPQPGRQLHKPLMFNDDYLKNLLERKEYEYILDRACTQFEPDDSEYQKITSLTYQHLNEYSDFQILRSTRHFGPLVFFLAWFKMIDNLLLELIGTSNIADAKCLLVLYNKLNEKDAIGEDIQLKAGDDISIIEQYISEKSSKKGQLELALQSYKELLKNRSELEHGIQKAHGIV